MDILAAVLHLGNITFKLQPVAKVKGSDGFFAFFKACFLRAI
jgi:hypothetical protein